MMDIGKLIETISTGDAVLIAVVILSLVQITPIKINPWSALFGWIGKKMVGELSAKVDDLGRKIESLEAKEDERDAVNKRVRILRFEDELQRDQKHTKESFDQVMSDITDYNQYCTDHPKFRNDQTVQTVEHIRRVYADRLEHHDFL